jgi:hypothetical protein
LPDGVKLHFPPAFLHLETGLAAPKGGAFILRESSAADVSTRVDRLIERHHGGDRALAARRLGISAELLGGLLSGNWGQFSLAALVAVIRTHGVTIDWLLGPTSGSWVETTHSDRTRGATNIEPETLS